MSAAAIELSCPFCRGLVRFHSDLVVHEAPACFQFQSSSAERYRAQVLASLRQAPVPLERADVEQQRRARSVKRTGRP